MADAFQASPRPCLLFEGEQKYLRRMARGSTVTGDAGTYLVAAELALLGWPSALTTTGTARTDLLAQVGARALPAALQVKTKGERSRDFHVAVRKPAAPGANEWVVLVSLHADRDHRFFVVPRDVVVAVVKAHGVAFPDASRVLLGPAVFDGYENEWRLLEEPSSAAPWRIPGWVWRKRDEISWPDGHAGIPASASPDEE